MMTSLNAENQIDKAREALKYFHNQSSKYSGYDITFDRLLDIIGGGGQKTSIFMEGFGFSIEQVQSDGWFLQGSKIEDAMESLADRSQGKIPNQMSFFKALSDEASNISFLDAAAFTAQETGKELLTGAQSVGDSVITTLKGLNSILPILVIGGVIYIAVSKIRKVA